MIELSLCIFYFIIFCFLICKIPFFKDDIIPKFWFIIIFGIKIIVSVLLTLIYTKYYTDRNTADIFKYYDDSNVMFDALLTNPIDYFKMLIGFDNDTAYFSSNYYQNMCHWTRPYSSDLFSDTHIIIRFNAFVRLFSFGHFQVHNVFINFISLLGLTLIYKAFKPFLALKEKVLFYVIFLIPSVVFWGSGLLKESIIFFGLGLLLNNLFKITIQFKSVYLLLIAFGVILTVYTKFYLLITLSIPITGYLLNHYLRMKKVSSGYLISTTLFFIIINIAPYVDQRIDFITQIVIKQQTFSQFASVVATNSSFSIPELTDGYSILLNIPNALNNTIIRPFFWECNSLFVWLSAIENIVVIFCISIALFFRKKMDLQQKDILFFNLSFVLFLFLIIGLTTPVFGAIIRYKIPGLILLLVSLLLFVDLEKIKSKSSFLNKLL